MKFVAIMKTSNQVYAVGPFDTPDEASDWGNANESATADIGETIPILSRRAFQAEMKRQDGAQ